MRRRVIVMAIVGALLLLSNLFGFTRSTHAASSSLGSVRFIQRGLAVQPPHHKASKGKVRQPLFALYGLSTKVLQRASIAFADGSLLHINQETVAVLRSPSVTQVKKGQVAEVVTPGTTHQVQTGEAVASAIGTSFGVKVKRKKHVTIVVVVEGAVLVQNKQGSVLVKTGQKSTVKKGQAPTTPVRVNALKVIAWTGFLPAPATPVGMNIGLDANGASAGTSSSTRSAPGSDLWDARWIDDGRLDYGWASAPGQTANQWVKIALPRNAIHTIRGVVIDPAATQGQPAADDLKAFEIRVSTTTLADAAFTTVLNATTTQSNSLQRFTLSQPVRAKYVELFGLTNYGGSDGIDVAEMEIVASEELLAPRPPVFHLVGAWLDGSNPIHITQSGDTLTGTYDTPYVCRYRDGTGRTAKTLFDFKGTLDGSAIVGQTTVCHYGAGNPQRVGLHLASMKLKVSADGKTIKGTWFSVSANRNEPMTIRRKGS
jgi:hypothetical protein